MAEIAVSFALKQLTSLLRDLRGVHKEFADIKDELESIRAFLKDADKRAAAEEISSDGVQIWVKQLTKAAFRIEDVLDRYMIYMPEQPYHLGFVAASLHKIVHKIKTLKPRWEMASEIQDIKSDIQGIKDRRERYAFNTSFDHQGSSSNSWGTHNIKWHDPRIASFFIEEDEVVGFEAPRDELIRFLVRGAIERTIISVVGMGGAGKTTLAKKVFDNKEVAGHFDCRACISVSQSYTIEELLKEMMKQFCEMMRKPLPEDFDKMNKMLLTTQLRNFIQQKRVEKSFTRSMYIFKAGELSESCWSKLFGRFKLLRVLEFKDAPLTNVPNKVGNLLHLRYLCLRGAKVESLPRTIGKLQNLETLDLRQTLVREMPREINKLRKLRHLMIFHRNYNNFSTSWNWETGVKMKDKNIGGLTFLQTLFNVEVDHGGVDLIEELKKLRQLRDLRLLNVRREYGKILCALINEMKHLQRLSLSGITEDELIDLHLVSSPPPQLKQLFVRGRLEKLPDWIPRLEYLVELLVVYSKLTDDPLKLLKDLPNLSFLGIEDDGYEGEILHFEECGFQKLKTLKLRRFHGLKSILIDKGALPLLQEFEFGGIPQLKEVPSGIRHLQHLQVLHIHEMQREFNQSIDPNLGHWVIQHVPIIHIHQKTGRGYYDYETRTILRASFAKKIDGEASAAN